MALLKRASSFPFDFSPFSQSECIGDIPTEQKRGCLYDAISDFVHLSVRITFKVEK